MRKNIFLICVMILLAGCAPVVTDIYNRECRGLTASQVRHLVTLSRAAMMRNHKAQNISPRELKRMLKTAPAVKINYRGDAYGTAFITWRLGTKIIGLRFDGELDAELPSMSLMTTTAPDADSILPDKSIPGR